MLAARRPWQNSRANGSSHCRFRVHASFGRRDRLCVLTAGLGPPGVLFALIRMAATITIGAWLATTGFHLLFTLLLSPAGRCRRRFRPRLRSPRSYREPIRSVPCSAKTGSIKKDWGDTTLTAGERLSIYVAVPTACLVLVRGLVLPPLGWDWLTYHGLRSAHFVQESSWTFGPAPGPWSKYRHFLRVLRCSMPGRCSPSSDLLNVCTWVQWLALGISAAALSEALGLGLRKAVIAGVAVLLFRLRWHWPEWLRRKCPEYKLVLAIAFAILFARTARPFLRAVGVCRQRPGDRNQTARRAYPLAWPVLTVLMGVLSAATPAERPARPSVGLLASPLPLALALDRLPRHRLPVEPDAGDGVRNAPGDFQSRVGTRSRPRPQCRLHAAR